MNRHVRGGNMGPPPPSSPPRPSFSPTRISDELIALRTSWLEMRRQMEQIDEADEVSRMALAEAVEDVRVRLMRATGRDGGKVGVVSPPAPERGYSPPRSSSPWRQWQEQQQQQPQEQERRQSAKVPYVASSPSTKPDDPVAQPRIPPPKPSVEVSPPSPPRAHTPPQRTMEQEALYSRHLSPMKTPLRPVVVSTLPPEEAIPTSRARNPPAIPVQVLKHVPLAVTGSEPAGRMVDPGYEEMDGHVIESWGNAGNVSLPPTMEVYLVAVENGMRKYHKRFFHLLGDTWVVFSSKDPDGTLRPREQVSLNAVIGFAPVDQTGQGHANTEPGWFLLSTTHSSYLAIAVHPHELQAWINWFISVHPLVQVGATAAVIRP